MDCKKVVEIIEQGKIMVIIQGWHRYRIGRNVSAFQGGGR